MDQQQKKRFSGRDLAEALAGAKDHFGLSRQDIGFTVVTPNKIGAVTDAPQVEIEAWPQPGANPAPAPMDSAPRGGGFGGRDRGPGGDRRPRGDRGGRGGPADRGDRGGRSDRGARSDRGGRTDRGDRGPRAAHGDRPLPRVRPVEEPLPIPDLLPPATLTQAPDILRHLVTKIVAGLDLDLFFEGLDENPLGVRVRLSGADAHLLTNKEGEGLDALQYLVNRILQKDGRIEGRVSVDAGGFRAAAEARLVEQVKELAEQVRATGQAHKLPDLSPYERRLVHMTLADTPGIKTFSSGAGYQRRLHIAPADAPNDEGADPARDS